MPCGWTNCCFFFQAEDGIRDLTVTGVQTCALPICRSCAAPRSRSGGGFTCPGGSPVDPTVRGARYAVAASAVGGHGSRWRQPRTAYRAPGRPLTLPDLLAGITFVALNAYALLGGADFGGGGWALPASGPPNEHPRRVTAHAVGPPGGANPRWLISPVVPPFTSLPPPFP